MQIRISPTNEEPLRAEAFKRKKSIPKTANEIIDAYLAEQRAKLKKGPSERSKKLAK